MYLVPYTEYFHLVYSFSFTAQAWFGITKKTSLNMKRKTHDPRLLKVKPVDVQNKLCFNNNYARKHESRRKKAKIPIIHRSKHSYGIRRKAA